VRHFGARGLRRRIKFDDSSTAGDFGFLQHRATGIAAGEHNRSGRRDRG